MDIIDNIRQLPTVINKNHESLYRSYNILRLVKEWCALGIPSEIISVWIDHMESAPCPDATPVAK